jgi:hypothetical protein
MSRHPALVGPKNKLSLQILQVGLQLRHEDTPLSACLCVPINTEERKIGRMLTPHASKVKPENEKLRKPDKGSQPGFRSCFNNWF